MATDVIFQLAAAAGAAAVTAITAAAATNIPTRR
jgi:hypothetical protein